MDSRSEVEDEFRPRRPGLAGATVVDGNSAAAAAEAAEEEEQHRIRTLTFALEVAAAEAALEAKPMKCEEALHTLKASINEWPLELPG